MAADSAGEAQVVSDHRTGARLTANGLRLDGDRIEPLRGPVDGGGETGRSCSHNGDVVELLLGLQMGAKGRCKRDGSRLHHDVTVIEERRWQLGGVQVKVGEQLSARRGVLVVEPIGYRVALEQIA
jgi:hypothetical protein